MTERPSSVEAAAIFTATRYATMNGYGSDPKAIGLVLVGMMIGAACSPDARRQMVEIYLRQHPDAAGILGAWIEIIDLEAAS